MERILVCLCGHHLDWHDSLGCHHRRGSACACHLSRQQVVDALIDRERESMRLFWKPEPIHAADG